MLDTRAQGWKEFVCLLWLGGLSLCNNNNVLIFIFIETYHTQIVIRSCSFASTSFMTMLSICSFGGNPYCEGDLQEEIQRQICHVDQSNPLMAGNKSFSITIPIFWMHILNNLLWVKCVSGFNKIILGIQLNLRIILVFCKW